MLLTSYPQLKNRRLMPYQSSIITSLSLIYSLNEVIFSGIKVSIKR